MNAAPLERPKTGERIVRGGTVLYFPAPNGTVRIVGLDDAGDWVAEFICKEANFGDVDMMRMERHVSEHAGVRISLVSG